MLFALRDAERKISRQADYETRMRNQVNKPVFVVGSPRSGTSILTWCLGQHPNLFPVPESNWMGDFAVNVAVACQIGKARGDTRS